MIPTWHDSFCRVTTTLLLASLRGDVRQVGRETRRLVRRIANTVELIRDLCSPHPILSEGAQEFLAGVGLVVIGGGAVVLILFVGGRP